MKKQVYKNLQLHTIYFPINAIVSILHRISGIILFIVFGFLLWILDISLSSPTGFQYIVKIMNNYFIKFIMWKIITIFIYHIFSGIRHMLMDFGLIHETLDISCYSAKFIIIMTIICSVVSGVLIYEF